VPEMRSTLYQKEACQLLLMSDGWRVFLGYILEQLTRCDRIIEEDMSAELARMRAIGARKALKALVHWVCATAEQPNPFDVHRQALWSEIGPLVQVSETGGVEAATATALDDTVLQREQRAALEQMRQQRQRGGGGVA
jgi:hypothetical protein